MPTRTRGVIRDVGSSLIKFPNANLVYLCFGVGLVTIAAVMVVQNNLPPEVPLFYGRPEGVEQLAGKQFLVVPSLVALGVLSANTFFSFFVRDFFVQKVLVFTAFVSLMFAIITTVKIVLLVGSF